MMSKETISVVSFAILIALSATGCLSSRTVVNDIPEGEQAVLYNRAVTEVESEAEIEN